MTEGNAATQQRMRLFVCTDHAEFYPVGCASIVLAESEGQAVGLLDAMLKLRGLAPSDEHPYHLTEVAMEKPQAIILRDGEY